MLKQLKPEPHAGHITLSSGFTILDIKYEASLALQSQVASVFTGERRDSLCRENRKYGNGYYWL